MQSGGKDGKKPAKSGGRGERLKAALRENLKRRKEQARARGGDEGKTDTRDDKSRE